MTELGEAEVSPSPCSKDLLHPGFHQQWGLGSEPESHPLLLSPACTISSQSTCFRAFHWAQAERLGWLLWAQPTWSCSPFSERLSLPPVAFWGLGSLLLPSSLSCLFFSMFYLRIPKLFSKFPFLDLCMFHCQHHRLPPWSGAFLKEFQLHLRKQTLRALSGWGRRH